MGSLFGAVRGAAGPGADVGPVTPVPATADAPRNGVTLRPAGLPVTVIEPRPGWRLVDFRELWRYRELLYFLALRDVKLRYKQTALGVAWDEECSSGAACPAACSSDSAKRLRQASISASAARRSAHASAWTSLPGSIAL